MTQSYITFEFDGFSESGKTSVWQVWSKEGGNHLGDVRWFGRWRCYAFFPNHSTVFERKCLRDIADFCERETQSRTKAAKGAARP